MESKEEKKEGGVDEDFMTTPAILDKYKASAEVANKALEKAIELCVVGADIFTVCQEVDALMLAQLAETFSSKKTKKLERGIAFPCCISVNHVMGHYSPMGDESTQLAEGDIAKIDLGCHLDGFIAQAAHTVIVSADEKSKVTGAKADVVVAAHTAMEAAKRCIAQGSSSS